MARSKSKQKRKQHQHKLRHKRRAAPQEGRRSRHQPLAARPGRALQPREPQNRKSPRSRLRSRASLGRGYCAVEEEVAGSDPRVSRKNRAACIFFPALIGAPLGALALGCGPDAPRSPHVVLIVLASLRAEAGRYERIAVRDLSARPETVFADLDAPPASEPR